MTDELRSRRSKPVREHHIFVVDIDQTSIIRGKDGKLTIDPMIAVAVERAVASGWTIQFNTARRLNVSIGQILQEHHHGFTREIIEGCTSDKAIKVLEAFWIGALKQETALPVVSSYTLDKKCYLKKFLRPAETALFDSLRGESKDIILDIYDILYIACKSKSHSLQDALVDALFLNLEGTLSERLSALNIKPNFRRGESLADPSFDPGTYLEQLYLQVKDPQYTRTYYKNILPEFKTSGKAASILQNSIASGKSSERRRLNVVLADDSGTIGYTTRAYFDAISKSRDHFPGVTVAFDHVHWKQSDGRTRETAIGKANRYFPAPKASASGTMSTSIMRLAHTSGTRPVSPDAVTDIAGLEL